MKLTILVINDANEKMLTEREVGKDVTIQETDKHVEISWVSQGIQRERFTGRRVEVHGPVGFIVAWTR